MYIERKWQLNISTTEFFRNSLMLLTEWWQFQLETIRSFRLPRIATFIPSVNNLKLELSQLEDGKDAFFMIEVNFRSFYYVGTGMFCRRNQAVSIFLELISRIFELSYELSEVKSSSLKYESEQLTGMGIQRKGSSENHEYTEVSLFIYPDSMIQILNRSYQIDIISVNDSGNEYVGMPIALKNSLKCFNGISTKST